ESFIMFSIMQNVYQKQSTDLASRIQSQFKERVSRVDRGVKQAGFWVLFMTTMPSVLTETGFITNATEEKFLNSKEGQEYIASAIYRACRDYINEMDVRSGISAVRNEPKPDRPLTAIATEVRSEISFMVQVATSGTRKEPIPENFKGITDIREIKADDRYKYATGIFSNYPAAVEYRKKIGNLFPDAFVIAVRDNKILPLQDALNLTKRN
ncbi:MAG TPA: N-acetylmuramoyl-L-alanine amidase, partial [Bacteroidales bacterium]|nr:N-acetylmuramoyl-L-alanine amidase [Bacteroidales bacterium]